MEDSSLLKRPGTRHGVATALQSCPHPHAPQLSRSEVVPPALQCWGAAQAPLGSCAELIQPSSSCRKFSLRKAKTEAVKSPLTGQR